MITVKIGNFFGKEKNRHKRFKRIIFTPLGAFQKPEWWYLPPRPGPPPPPATSEVTARVTGKPIAAGSVGTASAAVSGTISGAESILPTAAAVSGPITGPVSGSGAVETSRAPAGPRAGSSPVLVLMLGRNGSLESVPVSSMLATVLVPVAGGASVALNDGPVDLLSIPVMGSGARAGILASFPFPAFSLVSRVGDLLDEVQSHLGVNVTGRVDWIQCPSSPQGLLHLLPAAAGAADQLDAVQHNGRLQLLLEEEF